MSDLATERVAARLFPEPPSGEAWIRRGQVLRGDLERTGQAVSALLGTVAVVPDVAGTPDPAAAAAALSAACIDRLRTDPAPSALEVAELGGLLVRITVLETQLAEDARRRRAVRMRGVVVAVGQLRRLTSTDELLRRVSTAAVEHLAFRRVVLTRAVEETRAVEDDDASRVGPPGVDGNADEVWGGPDHLFADLEQDAPRIGVPIVIDGRVLGHLHADGGARGGADDVIDREVLERYVRGFTRVYARTVASERLHAQRAAMRTLSSRVATLSEVTADHGLTSPREAPVGTEVGHPATTPEPTEDLTRRQQEIMELLVNGLTNVAIAERLFITEGTVKSHVKMILRKLRVVNRSQAIAAYLTTSDRALGQE